MRKDVLVLLSTYNGEKYICEQLNSILNQKEIIVKILIRDDGSNDKTPEILKQYSDKYENISVIFGNNIGWKGSFLDLVQVAPKSDFYSFADQDDYWLDDKLISAVNELERLNIPGMYYSSAKLVDDNLNSLNSIRKDHRNVSKITSLCQGFALGCTIVFNNELMRLLKIHRMSKPVPHDVWIPIVATYLGEVIYSYETHILYRQHQGNQEGGKRKSIFTQLKKRMFSIKSGESYLYYAAQLLEGYSEMLSGSDIDNLKLILSTDNSYLGRIILVLRKDFKRFTFKGTIFLKIECLLGLNHI